MTGQSEWTGKVGGSWAGEWQRTDRSFGVLTARLLDAARGEGFAQALDVGCGAGEIAVALAAGDPSARVIGVDISQDLLSVARQRGDELPNLRFEHGDAARWDAGEGERPDLIVSRHGVMFFDEPVAAFAHIAAQALPGARLAFSCFRERQDNGWVAELAGALPPGEGAPGDPDAPGPFAFGRRDRVAAILGDAGWQDIEFSAVDYPMIAGAGERGAAVDDALSYFLRIGPAARALAALDGGDRDRALAKLRAMLERHLAHGTVALPAAAWIVTARTPA